MVQIHLLGGVGATTAGRPVDLGPAKRRALLAGLALSAGAAVPVRRLIELVWGDDPPRSAEKTLQAHVARLRAALGADTIERVGSAYRLDVSGDAVDALRFQCRLDAGDIDGALAEWGGRPLAGLDAGGFGATVDRLVELWLGARAAQAAHLVEDDPAAAVAPLTELTATHPFREELWALLMTALWRVGRQADALAAYRNVSRQLRDELGIDPGPRLQKLETAILANDAPPVAPVPRTPTTVATAGGHLPARRPDLIGRDAECAAVLDALGASAIVTLVGAGGIGKTQLALAAAHAVADAGHGDVWLVELAPVTRAADVPRVVAEVVGVVERPAGTLTDALVATLQDRTGLLVVDNCEHVVESAAAVAAAVVSGCPGVQILATSRERLGVDLEQVVTVPPLSAQACAELFAARARQGPRGAPFAIGGDTVAGICHRLDGVPLAIELAAARTSALTPDELLARLDDALRLLVDGRRDDVDHHRTLRATIRWSYDLLAPEEQTVLQRLSVFAGPFGLDAAEDVAAGGGLDATDVAVLVSRLADQSMVQVQPGRPGRRFRLLDTVRAFAAEQLAATGAAAVLADRHARWCAAAVTRMGRLLAGPDEIDGVVRLADAWPNLRAAVDHACTSGDRELADALLRPIVGEIILRSQVEIGDWVERLLAITPADDGAALAVGVGWAAQRYAISQDPAGFDRLVALHAPPAHVLVDHARAFAHDDYPALAELGPQAVTVLHRMGQHHLAELAEPDRGVALLNLGRLDEADEHLAPLVKRYRAQGPPTLLNWTLMLRGYVAAFRGDHRESEELFAAAVSVPVPARTHSPNRPIAARFAWRRGSRRRALAMLLAHVDELLATGNMQSASIAALELLPMLTAMERLPEAARVLGYLQRTQLLEVPGFAALVASDIDTLASRPELVGDVATGRALEDRAALADLRRTLQAAVAATPSDGGH